MITFTMKHDKSFVKSGDERIYRGEKSAQQIKIVLPTAVNGISVADCQIRLCFALGQSGDFSVLENGTSQSEGIAYLYTVDSPLTQQAGIYRIWVEFWRYQDGHLDEPSFCLKSETAEFFVLPHPHSQDLVTPAQLSAFTQLQKTVEAYLNQANTYSATAENASEDARTQANLAQQSADNAAESAAAALARKSIFFRYAENASGDGMQTTPTENTAYVGIAFAEVEPTNPSDYAWFLQDNQATVRQGDPEIALYGGGRIVCTKDGSIVLQPDLNSDSNTGAHAYNFTTGVLNFNGGYASFVCGYQNRANGSQQLIAGQNNTTPYSKNMAVVGQFCDSRFAGPDGKICTERDPRPLFAVGAGTSTTDRKNAFAVYSNGEAVIQKEGEERMLLHHTLALHSKLIHQAMVATGSGAYESISVRIGEEKVTIPNEALHYAMISKIGAASRIAGGNLTAQTKLRLFVYDRLENPLSITEVPNYIKTLPDFGHGVSPSLCNEVDLNSGTYTQSCGVYVFTGEETILNNLGVTNGYYCMPNFDYDASAGEDIRGCWNYGDVGIGDISEKESNEPFAMGLRYTDTLLERGVTFYAPDYTAATLKAYFKERYESGSPICIVYRKQTPIVTVLEDAKMWLLELGENRTFNFVPYPTTVQETAWVRMQYQTEQEESV